MTHDEMLADIPVFPKGDRPVAEAEIKVKITSQPLEGEKFKDWKEMLEHDLETRIRQALRGQDDYGEVTVYIEDLRPRIY